ncbi:MAG TPA: tetratricopeptide repeat protein [Cyclobacteriaceae bacterium]|nr:tetratricopeptide repeat protein [Cyclobacteriaceae bacterium]
MKNLKDLPGNIMKLSMVLITLFLVTASCKKDNASVMEDMPDSLQAEREKVREFWDFYRAAQKHRTAGEFLAARDCFLKALEINARHEDALFNYGNMCYELGKYSEAEDAWNRLIAVHPLNARGHYQLGNLYMRLEDPRYFNLEKAGMEFHKALDLNREITGPLLRLGQILLIRNELKEAEQYFLQVNGTDIKNVEAYFQRGYIAWKQRNDEMAMQLFSKAANYSIQEKREGGVAVEGDTKGNISLKRPIGESLFHQFLQSMNGIGEEKIRDEMINRYGDQDRFLMQLRQH